MQTPYVRPPLRRAVQLVSGHPEWALPFRYSDGRYFHVEAIFLYLFDEIDEAAGTSDRTSFCYVRAIEMSDQCYHEIEVNFWPPVFEQGLIQFEDVSAQFEQARREVYDYLATVHPQRGLSEFGMNKQLDFARELVLASVRAAP